MFYYIEQKKNWREAQNYCRKHHTELASGSHQLESQDFKNAMRNTSEVWIGLFRDTWRWSDEDTFSFKNWDVKSLEDSKKKCAISNKCGKWEAADCNKKKPFFCYRGQFYKSVC